MPSVKKLLPATLVTALAALAASAFVLTSALPAHSARPARQQPPQQDAQQGPIIRSQVNLVNIFATVRDHSKRIVTDLKQQDFKIQEDGQDQQIAFFSREVTLPITLALLLDTSGSEQFMLGAIQQMGGSFLDRVLRKGDEALIMSFDTDVDLLSDWTDDRGLLDRAIRKTRINAPMGGGMINPGPVGGNVTGTAFYDAVYLA
ncbi:MAG: VWA domain-containing protein, partial [Acidobacteria bacterium]|nr:VWA domain-containing protein [Acidobacteriota bacterium]